MTSDKQLDANRRNALRSTGPKTAAGKANVSLNPIKHGLLSQKVLLPNEDEAALSEFSAGMRECLQPDGELEDLLVDRIISDAWRLRRLLNVETQLFESSKPSETDLLMMGIAGVTWGELGLAFAREANGADSFTKLSRYETTIEGSLFRSLHELQILQAMRGPVDVDAVE